ncbi:MAG: hypothetical protein IT426_04645 [Pirellulales bacterium]|nr:hypothetical protein [Pirellulales bacterium]
MAKPDDSVRREKVGSVFETHTQLYRRGEAAEPLRFGRLVLVFEDGAGFITHYHALPRDRGVNAYPPSIRPNRRPRFPPAPAGRIKTSSSWRRSP